VVRSVGGDRPILPFIAVIVAARLTFQNRPSAPAVRVVIDAVGG
jgi:hypothetical protein